jgi:hypothetical protein
MKISIKEYIDQKRKRKPNVTKEEIVKLNLKFVALREMETARYDYANSTSFLTDIDIEYYINTREFTAHCLVLGINPVGARKLMLEWHNKDKRKPKEGITAICIKFNLDIDDAKEYCIVNGLSMKLNKEQATQLLGDFWR